MLATALGPLVFGFLLGGGMTYDTLIRASLGLALVAMIVAWGARRRIVPAMNSSLAAQDPP